MRHVLHMKVKYTIILCNVKSYNDTLCIVKAYYYFILRVGRGYYIFPTAEIVLDQLVRIFLVAELEGMSISLVFIL